MQATIDGQPVQNLASFRVQSPLFSFGPLPDNNVLQFQGAVAPAGATSPSVADGFYLLIEPLAPGMHTVQFSGGAAFSTAAGDPFYFTFSLDITYHLTVAPQTT